MGRKSYRQYERMEVKEACELTNGIVTAEGMSQDASEGGISVLLKEPVDFDDEEEVFITVHDRKYEARVRGRVVLVMHKGDQWKYVFSIDDIPPIK